MNQEDNTFNSGGLRPAPRPNSPREKVFYLPSFLPVPGGIKMITDVGWGDDKVDPLMMGLCKQTMVVGMLLEHDSDAAGAIKAGLQGNAQETKDAVEGCSNKKSYWNKCFSKSRRSSAINSNLELLFTGPELRTFNFTFNFTPRERRSEAQVVKNS